MKNSLHIVLLALGLMLAPVAASAQSASPVSPAALQHTEWFACESDGDCIRDSMSCGGLVSVNQAHLQEYHDAIQGRSVQCPDLSHSTHMILDAMKSKCESKRCVTALPGHPSSEDIDAAWFACSADTDCFYDAGACGGPVSLNASFRDQYHKAMLKRVPNGTCGATPLPKDLTPGAASKQAVAMCRNQQCTTVISASAPDTGKPDGRWMACESDDDCVKTDAICDTQMPVNKKYADRLQTMLSDARPKVGFACYFVSDKAKQLTHTLNARCKFNVCTLDK